MDVNLQAINPGVGTHELFVLFDDASGSLGERLRLQQVQVWT